MSERGDVPALKDIVEAINRVQRYIGTMGLSEFLENTEKQDAVARNLGVIGEAVKKISPEFRRKHSEIEWTQMAGFRDKIVHDYYGVNLKILWDVILEKLPGLKDQVTTLLDEAAD
ncbi:MAG: hypothetical protein A3H29_18225 [Acidobacteria bacterium RIFCSPLOWO2_02_FULL_67_21]|nr:MAG: hypothetical protein A3H29_18225 [Acidobacteria bacterium RIFCSPLOWO2_02_FULL_67_21]